MMFTGYSARAGFTQIRLRRVNAKLLRYIDRHCAGWEKHR
jgi:hypothetical protein